VIAVIGISVAARAQLGADMPVLSILALVSGSAISAEGNVILKIYSPKSDPMATNALTLTSGVLFLILASFFIGEPHPLPALPATWIAIAYTVIPGTVIMFYLYLWMLVRWSASGTSYVVMLFPIVATIEASLLAGEKITLPFILGGILVLLGVWMGALMKR
jgi:drug/metabolite transporter (DMT)-like permease